MLFILVTVTSWTISVIFLRIGGLICWIPKCCSHVGGWCKRRSFADGDLFGLPLSWPTGSFLVIFEMFRLGWSAFPKTIRTRNLSFAYKKKTRKKWKYNHLKSKSQLYFRNELLPSSGLVGCVGYCWSLVRGPVDLWSVSSRVDWRPVAPVQSRGQTTGQLRLRVRSVHTALPTSSHSTSAPRHRTTTPSQVSQCPVMAPTYNQESMKTLEDLYADI